MGKSGKKVTNIFQNAAIKNSPGHVKQPSIKGIGSAPGKWIAAAMKLAPLVMGAMGDKKKGGGKDSGGSGGGNNVTVNNNNSNSNSNSSSSGAI